MSVADLGVVKQTYGVPATCNESGASESAQRQSNGLAQYLTFAVPFCGCEHAIRFHDPTTVSAKYMFYKRYI